MLLRLVLWFAAWKINRASQNDPDIKELIREAVGVLQVTTVGDTVSRYYVFNNGAFNSAGGVSDEATVTMTFENSSYGFKVMWAMIKNRGAIMEGIQQKKIGVEGDLQFYLWFVDMARQVVKKE